MVAVGVNSYYKPDNPTIYHSIYLTKPKSYDYKSMIQIRTQSDTQKLARLLAKVACELLPELTSRSLVIFLQGTLGVGKTTFSRYFIQALGHKGAVKSPTYGLVEEYDLAFGKLCHFDLYRLSEPEELEYIGIREYLAASKICLIEWPEHAQGLLPKPDLDVRIQLEGLANEGRKVCIEAQNQALLEKYKKIEREF